MAEGWIKVHRNIQAHWIWAEKPFSRGQAWLDLILLANHAPKKIPIDGKPVVAERGEHYTSEMSLSVRWGWSRKKVHQFLDRLAMDNMVGVKRHSKGTVLNIVNYSVWQDEGTAKGPQKSIKRASEEHQKNTNKNEKNEKNEKKDMHTSWNHPEAVAHGPFVRLLASEFDAMVTELGESRTNDLILRLNGYIEQIGEPAARKKYKSHKATMMNWHRADVEKGIYRKKEVPNDGYAQWT